MFSPAGRESVRQMSQSGVLFSILCVFANLLTCPSSADAQPSLIGRSKEPIRDVVTGINTQSENSRNWYIAVVNFGPPGEDLERHCVSIDFYGNELSWAQDDTIETARRLLQRIRPHNPFSAAESQSYG
jgi:hypothetical protein